MKFQLSLRLQLTEINNFTANFSDSQRISLILC